MAFSHAQYASALLRLVTTARRVSSPSANLHTQATDHSTWFFHPGPPYLELACREEVKQVPTHHWHQFACHFQLLGFPAKKTWQLTSKNIIGMTDTYNHSANKLFHRPAGRFPNRSAVTIPNMLPHHGSMNMHIGVPFSIWSFGHST